MIKKIIIKLVTGTICVEKFLNFKVCILATMKNPHIISKIIMYKANVQNSTIFILDNKIYFSLRKMLKSIIFIYFFLQIFILFVIIELY